MTTEDERRDQVATLHDNTNTPRDDRKARGSALRAAVPLKSHAGWSVPADRPDPLDLLHQADEGRRPELIPIRYGRMSKTPFTFFRGSAAVMASDLSSTPNTRVKVQACGDCHALNFGAFATPERNVVFDLNDFDETLPGPWEWDLKRLVVSLVLIARDNGLKRKVESEVVEAAVSTYRMKMQEYARMPILDIWYDKIDWQKVVADAPDERTKETLESQLEKAQRQTIKYHYFPKLVQQKDGKFVIKDNPPLIYHLPNHSEFSELMIKGLELYKTSLQDDKQRLFDRYNLHDLAIKVVGVGSVGTTCAIALYLGPDDDPLFLQIKEARASVLEPYCGKSTFENRGQRVVAGQRIIQSASDIFLGWMSLDDGRDFYVRQLRDTKVKLNTEDWGNKQLVSMGELTGAVLARAHARSGDSAVISGYMGETDEFDLALADFAISYCNQVEKDHASLVAAIKSGRIKADPSV
jgi:uncharacterized protein (DUF2252 family)